MIMTVAAKLFAERGYDGVGISEVGEATGFGKGALYYHIKSKEDLLFDIMTIYMMDLIAAARGIAESDLPAAARLSALSSNFMSIMFASRAEMTVCFREVHALSEARQKGVLRLHSEYLEIWDRIFRDGAASGEFRPMTRLEIKALLGMFFYSFLWVKTEGSIRVEAIAGMFADLTRRAVRSDRA
ncbi:TetR/AcrR family transcriptional regulator [Aminobacter sp. Piv2-1]|uniref:TetR/AcrR family transcriptional regulator n=1 Tax=Aminobacter sp. Piv2-1 TaxID=3031122 RepID=UPI0030A073E4